MEKIEAESRRAESIKAERAQLLEARLEMRRQAERWKQEMMENFEKMKAKGKMPTGSVEEASVA